MKKNEKIAVNRIKILFKQAELSFKNRPERSHRYVELARKIAMKVKIKIPSNLKRKFCKHCYNYLQPGVNCRVRTRNKMLIYYCLNCKKYNKLGLKKPK